MFEYLKKVIEHPKTKSPRTHSFIAVISTLSLCTGFLTSVGTHLIGRSVSESIILGLAGILATLAGANYAVGKISDKKQKNEEGEL